MKWRDFVWATAVLISMLLPEIGLAAARPCAPGVLSATGGSSITTSCGDEAAQADWTARSTGAGVVWAHDFTYPEEFSVFDFSEVSISAPYVKAPSRVASGGPNGKPFLRLTHPQGGPFVSVMNMQWVSSTMSDGVRVTVSAAHGLSVGEYVQFVQLPQTAGTNGAKWAYFNVHGTGFGSNQFTTVKAIENSTTFVVNPVSDLQGAAPANFPTFVAAPGSAVHRGRNSSGHWKRPFTALVAGSNGKPTPDAAANGTLPRRSWTIGSSSKWYALSNKGFYGHSGYHGSWTQGVENTSQYGPVEWDGDEWYLQFRARMSASRFVRGQPAGKLLFVEYLTRNTGGEIVVTSSAKYPVPAYSSNWATAAAGYNEAVTHPWYMYYGKPTSVSILGNGNRLMPGGPWDSSCLFNTKTSNTNACWWWPSNSGDGEWVTVLMHFKPGKDSGGNFFERTGWPTPKDPTTWLEVWIAPQGQGYQKVFERRDIAWSWSQNDPPNDVPGFNAFTFSTYMNEVSGTDAFTHDFAEIIFSKQFIPAPTT